MGQAEAILQAAEEARWCLRRLLGACELVRAALRGERPPTRWEVIPVRSRKQRAARVERAKVRKEAAPSGPDVASPAEPPPAVPVVGAGVPLGLTAWRQASSGYGLEGCSQRQLAQEYGVTQATIVAVVRGLTRIGRAAP